MTRDEYIRRFDRAARFCRDLAQLLVVELLPERIKFDIGGVETIQPEPDGRIKLPWGGRLLAREELSGMEYVRARKIFWVDGRIPPWINFNVIRIQGEFTVIRAVASRRVTGDDSRLYRMEGNPPFHVLSPPLPDSDAWVEKEGRLYFYLSKIDTSGWGSFMIGREQDEV